ncbi:DUF4825 domain-containing protein [bacterium 210820-DFI.6.37]|nr:DUF4825 domain-containing protein [bacterium 210820-DFI.6.37]
MKTVRRVINKNLKMILIIAAVTVIALGVLLMLISGNEERNQVPTVPSQSAQNDESEEAESAEPLEPLEETSDPAPGISKEAQSLFEAKVASLEDSAAVAQLLETIDLKKNVASYIVTLQFKKAPKSLNITFDKTVAKEKKDSFDRKMQVYAEQILALVSDADEVQWTYYVKEQGKKKEEVTVYLDEKQATELLKNDVKQYGESEKMVQALLNQQKGQ